MDLRWIDQPIAVLLMTGTIFALRAAPIRLSKYSYLTQTGIPVLVGAVAVGPTPVVLGLYLGVLASDVVWLRKLPKAGFINAGREVIGFVAAYGPYAAVHYFSGRPPLSLDFLPAAAILVCLYFFSTRSLFYFTLLVRDKLEYAEKILILRWEIISYLLTLIATVVAVAAVQTLAPVGWVAVGLALGVLGLLTRKIIEEAIGAEDLNKVHLMETAIASNATLQGSFDQIERLAYRLLDWGDFRVYRIEGAELRTGVPRHAGPARPDRPAGGDGPAPARGDRVGGAGGGPGRPARPESRARDAGRRQHRGAPDPVRRRDARRGRGGSPQAPRLRPQGPGGARHAGQPDGDRDPHRGAAPPAAQHRGPDRRAGHRAGAGDRVAARLGRGAWPKSPAACGRRRPTSSASSPAGSAPPTRSPPPAGRWRRRAPRPRRRAAPPRPWRAGTGS